MADVMADIAGAHAEHVMGNVAAEPNSRKEVVAEPLLNEGTDEVVSNHVRKRVLHSVLTVVRALRVSFG